MDDGTRPVSDEELLYRRIPVSTLWYTPADGLKAEAFAPHKINDLTGLSVHRAEYKSIEQAGQGQPGKRYYVAVLRVGDLKPEGIRVEPRPQPGDSGHAELPDLNTANRKSDRTLELQEILVALTLRVEGPFG